MKTISFCEIAERNHRFDVKNFHVTAYLKEKNCKKQHCVYKTFGKIQATKKYNIYFAERDFLCKKINK